MRAAIMVLSVLLVLTGCMAGVDPTPGSAAEMRAAVGRSAHVIRETYTVDRSGASVAASVASRAQQCLLDAWMAREDDRIALIAEVATETAPLLVVDFRPGGDRTSVEVTRGRGIANAEAAAILAWARGDTGPCPERG